MTDNNGSGKPEQAKFDGVVNELRNVLSGLGNTPPMKESAPAAAPPDDSFSESMERPARTEKVNGGSNGNGHAPSAGGSPLASDADFWNGNVLGWPSNADADLPSVPVISKTSTEPTPADNGFLREEPGETGFDSMPTPVESDFDKLSAAGDDSDFMPPVPEPIEKSPEAWPLLKDADSVIPAPPLAPAPIPLPVAPPVIKSATSADPWMQSGFGLDAPAVDAPPNVLPPAQPAAREPEFVIEPSEPVKIEPVESSPAPSLRPAADFEFELPIPGTIEKKEAPAAVTAEHLDLGGTEMKPRDLVQVACIYPEGQEKAGQTFVTKLREAAEKLRTPITVQAVFVSAWSPDKIEPQAWAKSASLSGADAMFILAFRANGNLFRNLGETTSKAGTKARLVLLEQTTFPTLYADILVELRRAR